MSHTRANPVSQRPNTAAGNFYYCQNQHGDWPVFLVGWAFPDYKVFELLRWDSHLSLAPWPLIASPYRARRRHGPGQQAVSGDKDAGDDQHHAPGHLGIHRHVGEPKAVVAAHPEHRQVQQHAGRDGHTAEPEGPHVAAVRQHMVGGGHRGVIKGADLVLLEKFNLGPFYPLGGGD